MKFTSEQAILADAENKTTEKTRFAGAKDFRQVLENSRDVIYRLNLKTKTFDYISPATREISGLSFKSFLSLINSAKTKIFRQCLNELLHNNRFVIRR